jgi:hypothetical protein
VFLLVGDKNPETFLVGGVTTSQSYKLLSSYIDGVGFHYILFF